MTRRGRGKNLLVFPALHCKVIILFIGTVYWPSSQAGEEHPGGQCPVVTAMDTVMRLLYPL